MDEFLQIFGDITLSTTFIFIAALVFLVSLGTKIYKIIIKNHDMMQERETLLEELQKSLKEIEKNSPVGRHEWKELRDKQNNLETTLNEILEAQKIIAAKQDAFEEENRLHNLNKLRDRLLQSYRYYTNIERNPLGAWSEMEQEAFDKLFNDYEALGGDGFMHTTVSPAMSSLEVVRMDNQDKITELMRSRKG
jgi:DNA repair exonuclease SbcCD ATPase subunit